MQAPIAVLPTALTLPASQSVHVPAAAPENLPETQSVHVAPGVAPEAVPSAQSARRRARIVSTVCTHSCFVGRMHHNKIYNPLHSNILVWGL